MQTLTDKLEQYNVPHEILVDIAMLEMDLQRAEAVLHGTWPDAAKILSCYIREWPNEEWKLLVEGVL